MAIAFVQSTGNYLSSVTSISQAFAANNTAGNLLVAAVLPYSSSVTPSISDSQGNTWTQAVSYQNNSISNTVLAIFYCVNCKGGANTITGSWGGSSLSGAELHISEFSGADVLSPLDTTATGSSASGTTATTSAMTPSANGELIWGVCTATGSTTLGSGWTLIANEDADKSEYQIQTTAASVQGSWTVSGGWVCVAACFKPPSVKHFLLLVGVGS